SVLLQQLSDRKGVVKGFGLDAGSPSYTNPRDGHLIVGGYDKVRVSASFKDYNISDTQISRRICPLQVIITELILSRPGIEDVILSSRGEQIPACIEPYDVLFRFPERTLRAFAQETEFANGTLPDPSEFYIVEPGITYPSDIGFNGSLKFTLDNDFVVEIPNEELVHPLRGIARDGTKTLMTNTTEINVFRDVALLDTAVLGKAFLSRVYLVVEYRSSGPIFRIAKSNSGNLPPNPVPFEPDCTPSQPDQGPNLGKIIGIAVGTINNVTDRSTLSHVRYWHLLEGSSRRFNLTPVLSFVGFTRQLYLQLLSGI
ncbi:10840_t:CDS:2, partial [Acaulospora colombiana]